MAAINFEFKRTGTTQNHPSLLTGLYFWKKSLTTSTNFSNPKGQIVSRLEHRSVP